MSHVASSNSIGLLPEIHAQVSSFLLNSKQKYIRLMKDPHYFQFTDQMIAMAASQGEVLTRRTAAKELWAIGGQPLQLYIKNGSTETSRLQHVMATAVIKYFSDICHCSPASVAALLSVAGSTTLRIDGCGQVNAIDLEPIKHLENLETLLISDTRIVSLQPLTGLRNLKTLILKHSPGLTDLEPLRSLTGLKKLELDGCDISDIGPLESLTDLTDLSIRSNTFSDISSLRGLTKLEKLALNENPNLTDISAVAELTRLKLLCVDGTSVTDIRCLSGLNNLERLAICRTLITEVEPLRSLPRLRMVRDLKYGLTGALEAAFNARKAQLQALAEENPRLKLVWGH